MARPSGLLPVLAIPSMRPSASTILKDSQGPVGKILSFWAEGSGHCNRCKINFDSPRTAEAAAKIGVTFEDCMKRHRSDFFAPGVDERIAQIKYDRHCIQAQENMARVYETRERLLKRKAPPAELSMKPTSTSHLNILATPTNFSSSPNAGMLSSSASQPEFHHKLGRAEKMEMKNFIDRAWKELVMLETDQQRSEAKLNATTSKLLSSSSSAKRSKPPIRNNNKASASSTTSRQNIKKADGSSTSPEKSLAGSVFMTQTEGFADPKKLEEVRIERREKIMKCLQFAEEQKRARASAQEAEWLALNKKLGSIQHKLETAEENMERKKCEKASEAAKTGHNTTGVMIRAQERRSVDVELKERQYMEKALKIEEKKQTREVHLRQEMERRRVKYIEKKKRQDEEYQKQRQIEKNAQSQYAAELAMKERKISDAIARSRDEERGYYRELARANQGFQAENKQKLERIHEHRRKQVIQQQQALRERNDRKSNTCRTYDSNFRKQAVMDQKAREETLVAFNKLVKMYPSQTDQRKKMASTLQTLNAQLNLGLKLDFPKKSTTRHDSGDTIPTHANTNIAS